jgi:hypothetical protein
MSDFITELRRELVDAAERERRRSAPRRAVRRARRPLATAFAGAAAVAAAMLGLAVLGREEAEPVAQPHIAATIRLGGFPVGATVGAGSVWVSDGSGRVLRVDPETRQVIARVPIGYDASAISASADAIWVVGARRMHEERLLRIDPRTNRIVAAIGSFGGYGAALGAAPDAVWVQKDKQAPGPFRRVDPATNRIDGGVGTGWLAGIAVHADRMWTLGQHGILEWRDSGTGRLLGRLPGFAERPPGGPWMNAIAPDDDGAWIATGRDGAITRVASDGRVELRVEIAANGPLAVAGGSLWVTRNDGTDRNAEIARVDPETGAVTGRLRLGARLPKTLLAVGDDLWAVLSDGSVLIVH